MICQDGRVGIKVRQEKRTRRAIFLLRVLYQLDYHDKPSMMFLVGINIRQDNIFICSLIPVYINVFQIIQIIPWYTKCSLWVCKTRKDNIFIRSRIPAGTMHAYIKVVQIVQNYNTLIALYIYNKLLIINRRKNVFFDRSSTDINKSWGQQAYLIDSSIELARD